MSGRHHRSCTSCVQPLLGRNERHQLCCHGRGGRHHAGREAAEKVPHRSRRVVALAHLEYTVLLRGDLHVQPRQQHARCARHAARRLAARGHWQLLVFIIVSRCRHGAPHVAPVDVACALEGRHAPTKTTTGAVYWFVARGRGYAGRRVAGRDVARHAAVGVHRHKGRVRRGRMR